ncbi:unnamed protein product [Brassica oleracea var. botrytis]|uniref:Uncharacterized protein n=3 Tax=Brassica TaxID=3705 RepID=A0A8X7PMW1_BRACI|nr:hypothetical protein Bca52824_084156 [Brassica carinata]CAF2064366.1 unnamed protein product [Brassica napus]VDD64259.1 unnamed protein product [Brassica oleracea]
MKRFHTPASLILLLLLLYSSYGEGRQMVPRSKTVRDLNINKEMKEETLRGEKDSFRRIPRSGSSPIQNRKGPLTYARRSRNQQITATEP